MIRAWGLQALLALWLFAVNPASGAIFGGGGSCGGTYPDTFAPLLASDQFNIPVTGQPGDFFGPWYSGHNLGNSIHGFPFFICAAWNNAYNNPTGTEDNLYVLGLKPVTVYASPDLASKDGYTVFTTSQLSAIGIGFILRWRVHTQANDLGGAWRSPSATWSTDDPPLSAGLPFYRFPAYSWTFTYGNYWLNPIGENNFSSVTAYRAAMDAVPAQYRGTNVFPYGAEVEVRYVLTKPTSQIYQWLDSQSGTITTDFVILRARPLSYQINNVTVRQTTTFKLPPLKTCETPSVAEATQNFNWVFASAIPEQGDTTAERDFPLTLRRCGRNNVDYYVHANGAWVNPSQGIVGLSGSTPDADPDIGNPRGFGIQLWHNGNQGGTGQVYIHPHELAPNTDPGPGQSYTLNWQGAGAINSSTGVDHTILLRAKVIRTSPSSTSITPGPFKASVVFVFKYQ